MDRDDDTESITTSIVSLQSSYSTGTTNTMPVPSEAPPPYSSIDQSPQWPSEKHNNNASRTSIPPTLPPRTIPSAASKRKLLLVWIHGFMGSETSFQRFPAHVHNLLTVLVQDSHVVHSKLYPRYKCKKAIQHATQEFSTWLEPHESNETDVVLLGHSLGGVLAAEVALLHPPQSTSRAYKHRILGTLSFDTPFLGMHPSVVKSGIGSIFQSSPLPPSSPLQSPVRSPTSSGQDNPFSPASAVMNLASGLFNSYPTDPNYDPAFPNDKRQPSRSTWESTLHFVQKHRKDLRQATKALVMSHLEFGGCLADFDGLKNRYYKLRMLEQEDMSQRGRVADGYRNPPRVRFSNYYTISTGRPKKPKSPVQNQLTSGNLDLSSSISNLALDEELTPDDSISVRVDPPSPRLEAHSAEEILFDHDEHLHHSRSDDGTSEFTSLSDLRSLDPLEPRPEPDDEEDSSDSNSDDTVMTPNANTTSTSTIDLNGSIPKDRAVSSPPTHTPPITLPNPPAPPDLSNLDKASYKRALKQFEDELKTYRNTLKSIRKAEEADLKAEKKHAKQESKRLKKTGGTPLGPTSTTHVDEDDDASVATAINTPVTNANNTTTPPTLAQTLLIAALERDKALLKASSERDKALVKAAVEREKAAQLRDKALQKAAKTREEALAKAAKEREKALAKAAKEREKAAGEREKALRKGAKEREKMMEKTEMEKGSGGSPSPSPSVSVSSLQLPRFNDASTSPITDLNQQESPTTAAQDQPKKPHTFCALPPLDPNTDERDPTWVAVRMEGVDEIGAHQGLFFPVLGGEKKLGDRGEGEEDVAAHHDVTSSASVDDGTEETARDDVGVAYDGGSEDVYTPAATPLTPTSSTNATQIREDRAGRRREEDAIAAKGAPEWSGRYTFLVRDVSLRVREWVNEAAAAAL